MFKGFFQLLMYTFFMCFNLSGTIPMYFYTPNNSMPLFIDINSFNVELIFVNSYLMVCVE